MPTDGNICLLLQQFRSGDATELGRGREWRDKAGGSLGKYELND